MNGGRGCLARRADQKCTGQRGAGRWEWCERIRYLRQPQAPSGWNILTSVLEQPTSRSVRNWIERQLPALKWETKKKMTSTPCTLAGTSSWSLIFCSLFPAREAARAPNPARPVQSRGGFLPNGCPQTSRFCSSYTARASQGLPVAIVRGDGASLATRWTLGLEENQNLGGFVFGFD